MKYIFRTLLVLSLLGGAIEIPYWVGFFADGNKEGFGMTWLLGLLLIMITGCGLGLVGAIIYFSAQFIKDGDI